MDYKITTHSKFLNLLLTMIAALRGYLASVLARAHPYGEMQAWERASEIDCQYLDPLTNTIDVPSAGKEARRSAISTLLNAEARRQAEREAEAGFWRALDERGDCN